MTLISAAPGGREGDLRQDRPVLASSLGTLRHTGLHIRHCLTASVAHKTGRHRGDRRWESLTDEILLGMNYYVEDVEGELPQ